MQGLANTVFRVEFFATPKIGQADIRQGKTLLGAKDVTTDGSGKASFTFDPPGGVPAGQFLTATATDASNSSLFSEAFQEAVVVATTTRLTSSPEPSTVGQSVTFTATVTKNVAGSLSGNVTFREGTTVLGTRPISADGLATFVTSTLAAGPHTITAVYGGDAKFTSSSASTIQTVISPANRAGSATSLSAAPNPANVGQVVTLVAQVNGAQGSSGTPTGVVTFEEGTTVLGTGTLDGTGRASFSTSALARGSHTITALYGGDARFLPSTSASIVEVINAVPVVTGGPRVLDLRRVGIHAQPTVLVLLFDRPLNPSSAQNVANYQIVDPHGRLVPVLSAVYDPTARTVTLHPAHRLNLHQVYQLTVRGTAPGGLRDVNGNLLDGAGTGRAGSDYLSRVGIWNLTQRGRRGFSASLPHGTLGHPNQGGFPGGPRGLPGHSVYSMHHRAGVTRRTAVARS
ncbi:MAG: hypothetical protein NVSMB9_27710 [Isosphaeraceae bacterium]